MAIIPCRECAHQVSDQAASCPSCGAPIRSNPKTKPRTRRYASRALITLMTLWTLGTLLWLIQPRWTRDELITRARSTLQHLDPGTQAFQAPLRPHATAQPPSQQMITSSTSSPPPAPPPPPQLPAVPRSVYRTTAEDLYRDYEANAVATQARIGASLVRLNGSISAIDQDETGHPVVKLRTGKDRAAAMTLAHSQRAAAAQLYKGEAVDLECDKIGGSDAVLQGSGCTLVFVDIRTREVNLALFLTNEAGGAHVYVVGPMPEAVCRAHSEQISSRLRVKHRGEHLVWRSCTDAGRENILPGGCHLNAPSVTLPDVPSAHLWHYDCGSAKAAQVARTDADADSAPAPQPAAAAGTNNLRFASAAGGSDIGGPTAAVPVPTVPVPSDEVTVAHASPQGGVNDSAVPAQSGPQVTDAPQPSATPAPDDLANIRAVDPQAANHIAGYCSKAITSPTNRDALMADCRRNEAAAWTRLVLQNEFPTLDETTRQKCSEPPFPDTYVAKERCAKYELHAN
jgi:hypothetical protein